MKLNSFFIKNYRSIVNTGWKMLSNDNISVIIGQNESGKTSVLEALLSFYNGNITEDVLRSSLNFPEVSCSFVDITKIIEEIPKTKELPDGFIDFLNRKNRINLKRTWYNLTERKSKIELEENELVEIFIQDNKRREVLDEKVEKHIEKFQSIIENLYKKKDEIEEELREIEKEHKIYLEKKIILESELSNKNDNEKKGAIQEIRRSNITVSLILRKLNFAKSKIEKINKEIEISIEKYIEVSNFLKLKIECDTNERNIKNITFQNQTLAQKNTQNIDTIEKAKLVDEIEINKKKIEELNKRLISNQKSSKEAKFIISKVLEGLTFEQASIKVNELENINNTCYNQNEIAEYFFSKIPQFVFFGDFANLLPNQIDLSDIESDNNDKEGIIATKNFLKVANIDTSLFRKTTSQRILQQHIENINKEITTEFQEFWSQKVGKANKIEIELKLDHHSSDKGRKSGEPFLIFWIKDGSEILHPVQRSKGVRWFISFYLQLKAAAKDNNGNGLIMLIDEPGISLHARAKEDVIKVLENIKSYITVIYTTHSPYLLNINTIYRVLAAQRNSENADNSDTKLLTPNELGAASCDTLSPLYTLMGANFAEQNVISRFNNIILEEMSAFYYLKAFFLLHEIKKEYFLLPATGTSNIPQLANLLLGWGLMFGIIVDDDTAGRKVYNELKCNLYNNNDELATKKMIKLLKFKGIEDHFSKRDFKKFIFNEFPDDISVDISEYLRTKGKPKGLLALKFYLSVKNNNIKIAEFDQSTQDNIQNTLNKIDSLELEV